MYLIELNSWLLPSNRCATYNAIVMRLKPPCNIDGKRRATWVSVVWKPARRKQKLEEWPWACTVQAVSLVLVLFLARSHKHLRNEYEADGDDAYNWRWCSSENTCSPNLVLPECGMLSGAQNRARSGRLSQGSVHGQRVVGIKRNR